MLNVEKYAHSFLSTETQQVLRDTMVAFGKKKFSKFIPNSLHNKFKEWPKDHNETLSLEYEYGSRWGHDSRNAKKLFKEFMP